MIYRKLKKEELSDLTKLHSMVYFFKHDPDKPSDEPWLDKQRQEITRGAFTDDGNLAAVLEMIPFKAYLDNTVVGSPGIAGVATLLEHRRSGVVKNLMLNAYKEMYEKGDVMSYLYPFSHEYYRKYGYAQGSYADVITVGIDKLKRVKHDGYTKQYFPGDGYDDLKVVYNKFASQYNCCVAREDWRWKRLFSMDPYKENILVFIRYNSLGEPVAYLKFEAKEISEYKFDMNIYETAWIENDGLLGLISIINGYEGDLVKVKLTMPPGFPSELLVKDAWDISTGRRHAGMNRIINAKAALKIMRKPSESGRVVINVEDEHAPWNTGNWLVEWEKGNSSVRLTNEKADLTCRAPEFSQLVTGYFPLETMKITEGVEVADNEDMLRSLFIQKSCFIWDRF